MDVATNRPEVEEDKMPAKSAGEAQEEYKRLLEEYQRLKDEVDTEVRRMRGRRVSSWQEVLWRVLKSKQQ